MVSDTLQQSQNKSQNEAESMVTTYCVIESPVGQLLLAGNRNRLVLLSFQNGNHPTNPETSWIYDEHPFQETIRQLMAYFAGICKTFTIQTAPIGTPFQQKVWRALKTIPYGKTVSYSTIAKAIGQPHASRAVGAANGRNPLSIIVPCHRVIGSTGKLVGYGGGLPIKATLLTLEATDKAKKP